MMRRFICFIVVSIAGLFLCCSSGVKRGELPSEQFVSSFSGLFVRYQASKASQQIIKIPYGSRVKVIAYSGEVESIDNIESDWAYIDYEGTKGWVFAGYLKPESAFNDKGVTEFIRNPFADRRVPGIISASVRADLMSEFGRPHSVSEKTIVNEYSGANDTLVTLNYKGCSFQIYHCSEDGKEILCEYRITGGVPLKYGIRIGMKLSEVVEKLGYPADAKDNRCFYYPDDDSNIYFQFDYDESGELKEIVVSNWPD